MARVDLGRIILDSSPHPLASNPEVPKSVSSHRGGNIVPVSTESAEGFVGFQLLRPSWLPEDLSVSTAVFGPSGPKAILCYRTTGRQQRGLTISQTQLPANPAKKSEIHVSAVPETLTIDGRTAAILVESSGRDGTQTVRVFTEMGNVLAEVAAVGVTQNEVLDIVGSLRQEPPMSVSIH